MQIKVCLPSGHFCTLHICPLAAWDKGQSTEGLVCFHVDANGPFIYVPVSLQRQGGVGLGEVHIPFLQSLTRAASGGKASSKLAPMARGWAIVEGGGGCCCQANSRGICIRPSSPLHCHLGHCHLLLGLQVRVRHSLSPHARRVSQASPPPLVGPPEAPSCPPCMWLPRLRQGWVT